MRDSILKNLSFFSLWKLDYYQQQQQQSNEMIQNYHHSNFSSSTSVSAATTTTPTSASSRQPRFCDNDDVDDFESRNNRIPKRVSFFLLLLFCLIKRILWLWIWTNFFLIWNYLTKKITIWIFSHVLMMEIIQWLAQNDGMKIIIIIYHIHINLLIIILRRTIMVLIEDIIKINKQDLIL